MKISTTGDGKEIRAIGKQSSDKCVELAVKKSSSRTAKTKHLKPNVTQRKEDNFKLLKPPRSLRKTKNKSRSEENSCCSDHEEQITDCEPQLEKTLQSNECHDQLDKSAEMKYNKV